MLRPADFLKEIRAGKLRPVYYLAGEEKLRRDEMLNAVLKTAAPDPFNLQEYFGDSLDVGELVSSAQTPPMLSSRRVLVVKRAEALNAAAKKALAAYLEDPLPTTTLVLLVEGRPAKGDALEAAARSAGASAVFYALKPAEAVEWVLRTCRANKLDISEDAADTLVSEAGTDLAILHQELSKLAQFVKGKPGPVGVDQVLASLGFEQARSIWDLGTAVQKKDLKKALELLQALLGTEEPFRLLYQIVGTVEKQLKAKRLSAAGRPDEDVFRELRGVSRYFNPDFVSNARKRSEAELVAALERGLETEAKLKSNPAASPAVELELLLVETCGGKGPIRRP